MVKKVSTFAKHVSEMFTAFDIKGGAILGLFTLSIIALSIWATLTKNDIPGGVLTAYGTAIGCFALNKTFEPKAPRGKGEKGNKGDRGAKGVKAQC